MESLMVASSVCGNFFEAWGSPTKSRQYTIPLRTTLHY